MQAAAGGRRWRGSFFLGGGAGGCAAAVRSCKAGRLWALCRWRCWRWCVVIGCGGLLAWSSGAALVPVLVCCWQVVQVGGRCDLLRLRCAGVVIGTTAAQRPARAGLLIRQAGQAVGVEDGQKKKARAAARGALLLWPSVCAGGAICCAGCIPVHIVGGGGLLPVPVPGCWRWH